MTYMFAMQTEATESGTVGTIPNETLQSNSQSQR